MEPDLVDAGGLGAEDVGAVAVADHDHLVGGQSVALQRDAEYLGLRFVDAYLLADDGMAEAVLQAGVGELVVLHLLESVAEDGERVALGQQAYDALGVGEQGEIAIGELQEAVAHLVG